MHSNKLFITILKAAAFAAVVQTEYKKTTFTFYIITNLNVLYQGIAAKLFSKITKTIGSKS